MKLGEGEGDEEKVDAADEDEDMLSGASPLGLYAAEVGLAHAVASMSAPPRVAEPSGETEACRADDDNTDEADGACDRWSIRGISGGVLSRVVSANLDALRRLLAEDDLRELLVAVLPAGVAAARSGDCQRLGGCAAVVAVAGVAIAVAAANYSSAVLSFAIVAAVVGLLAGLRLLGGRVGALLAAGERCLAAQRACIRVARERRQIERGFTLVGGGGGGGAAGVSDAAVADRRWTALGRAAFESARRLTHVTRQLARDADLPGGLVAVVEDSDFGESFNLRLSGTELSVATDGFAPPALVSMAGLLQLHLSDTVRRLLVNWQHRPGWHLAARIRLVVHLTAELSREASSLEARLERQRRLEVDVDSLLEEFLGSASGTSATVTRAAASPMETALRSLRLHAEALLAKAALAERRCCQSLSGSSDLTSEARLHAVSAAACCDEIAALTAMPVAALQPDAPRMTAQAGADVKAAPCNIVVVRTDAPPAVEDEFLEGLVLADDDAGCSDDRFLGDVADDSAAAAVATNRLAARRMLGELDAVIAQRRRLFRERERVARVRRGLPPAADELDAAAEMEVAVTESPPEVRHKRRIVWHGTLEGDSDGALVSAGCGLMSSLAPTLGLSSLAAAALAARQDRGIRLAEEAFGDDGSGENSESEDAEQIALLSVCI